MMSRERETAPVSGCYRTLDYVACRPVVLDKVEICGIKVAQRVAKIPDHRNGLQENFRHQHCRSNIQIDSTTLEASHHLCKQSEIVIARLTERCRVHAGIVVGRVRAERDVYGHRNLAGI